MSLDGYIAAPDDDLSFLEAVHQEGQDYGYTDFISEVDTVIMGRKTYDWVMAQVPHFPHFNKVSYIITRHPRPSIGNTHFYTGDIEELVTRLKSQHNSKHIFVDGGAEIVNLLLAKGLIDELYISVIPVLLGAGVHLFEPEKYKPQTLRLLGAQAYDKGLVQLRYTIQKQKAECVF